MNILDRAILYGAFFLSAIAASVAADVKWSEFSTYSKPGGAVTIVGLQDGANVKMPYAEFVVPKGTDIIVTSGTPTDVTANGTNISLTAGSGWDTSGNGGNITIQAGFPNNSGNGGDVNIIGGIGLSPRGGAVNLQTGGEFVSGPGGDVTFTFGTGTTRDGLLFLNVPTSDPHIAGASYWSGSTLTRSNGP